MNEIVGHYVQIDGVRAYYETAGAGVPIVMLHTAGREGRQWHGIMERLGAHYQMIAPDLPGHGKSWPLAGNHCLDDIHQIAEWVWRFSRALALERPVIMGCSVGGNLALLLAALHPEIRAAIALQGAAHTPTFTDTALALMTHPQVSLMHANMDFSMSLVGSAASDEARAFSAWGVTSVIPVAQQSDLKAYTGTDTRGLLGQARCPVLIARGTEDWLVTQEMAEGALDCLTGTPTRELRSLPGLGHFPHVEDPARTAEMAHDFLKKYLID